jgi:hypothetical protein
LRGRRNGNHRGNQNGNDLIHRETSGYEGQ